MVWNAVVRVTVAKLLRDGLSAGQIAEKLPFAISRNAVIGLVHRDEALRAIGFRNAPRRPQGQKQPEPKPVPMPKPASVNKPAAKTAVTDCNFGSASRTLRHDPIERDPPTPPPPPSFAEATEGACPPKPDLSPGALAKGEGRRGVPLVQIRDGLCRFPLWDLDGAPDFLMCGCAARDGQSYCEGHRARTSAARAA